MADVNYLLKTVYTTEKVKDVVNRKAPTLKRLGNSSRRPGGKGFQFPLDTKGNQLNLGATNFGQSLPDGGLQEGVQGLILPKETVQVVNITGYDIQRGKQDYEAYADTLMHNLDKGLEDHNKDLNQQIFRTGSGIIAQVNGAVSGSNTVTFDNGIPTHIMIGMKLNFYAGNTFEDYGIVTDVDFSNNTFTLNRNITVSNNANFYRVVGNIDTKTSAATGKELNGLPLYTDDGSLATTYEDINRSTNAQFQGIAIDKNGANLTDDMLQSMRTRIKIQSGVDMTASTHMLITNPMQTRKYMSILTPAREYMVTGKTQPQMDSSGDVAPTWMGMEWVEDTDCGFNEIYIINRTDFKKYVLYDTKYDDDNGGILKWNGKDASVAFSKSYMNVGGEQPNSSARLYNLAVPAY